MGNYAQLLLARGETAKGLARLEEATAANGDKANDVAVELAFYWYAQGPAKERGKWLAKLKRLLVDGCGRRGGTWCRTWIGPWRMRASAGILAEEAGGGHWR
ncbi:MAG: hypothetical protein R3C99_08940 [Pirellulaceae bacterium]